MRKSEHYLIRGYSATANEKLNKIYYSQVNVTVGKLDEHPNLSSGHLVTAAELCNLLPANLTLVGKK
jgi:hypothetical protein